MRYGNRTTCRGAYGKKRMSKRKYLRKNLSFWKTRKILVTGYEGFLGSWLTKALLEYGANIWGLDIKTRRKETILSNKELKNIEIIKGSVENFPLVLRTIKENKIECIFHLAAKALVGECIKDPLNAFSSNIRGTWNVLEASRSCHSVKAIIISSSDKAYGSHNKLPYREDYPLLGLYPYDVSKSCSDLLANTYFHTYNVSVCVTRCGNIFGPGDFNFSRLVPDIIKSAVKNKELLVRSSGKFVRDYIYVKDIVNGYLLLGRKMLDSGLVGEPFNFSNEEPKTVLEMVKQIYILMGKKPKYKILNQAKYEIKKQYLSSKKAKRILKWQPQNTLKDNLEETVKWYMEYFGYKK